MNPGEERLSILVGDRPCLGCGYNLTGQAVLREPHYRMLIARCPECSTVAALQEYPLLGRWAGRWAALLAALWFIVLLVALLVSSGIVAGMSMGVAQDVTAPWSREVLKRYQDELRAQPTLTQTQQVMLDSTMIETQWLAGQDLDALLAAAGGWRARTDPRAFLELIWLVVAGVPIGCFWSVALLHVRRRRLPVAAVLLVSIAGAFLLIGRMRPTPGWGWIDGNFVAYKQIGAPFTLVALLFVLLPLSAGLLMGRAIVRGLVRAFLPPRMRGALALLWLADGLEPPRAR